MAWEVALIYGRPATVLKGAFPAKIFDHEAKVRPCDQFRDGDGPILLNVNRLEPRKRVSLAIDAFEEILETHPRARLIIGGTGPSEASLRERVASRGLGRRVIFVGFIPDEQLWDWLASCDVFVHPNWAEFAIAPYEALALGAKVVWTNEMELDAPVARTGLVHIASPTPTGLAQTIRDALASPRRGRPTASELGMYTWESYFDQLNRLIGAVLGSPIASKSLER